MKKVAFIDTGNGYGALQQRLEGHEGWLLLTDEQTSLHCKSLFAERSGCNPRFEAVLKPGEKNKSLASCEKIWNALTDSGAGRNFAVVNLGGGLVTDIGGFAASVYKRGIAFYNVPTTLLAMVDAAAGGKTGINFGGYKNHLGTFSFAGGTWIDEVYLNTLPDDELLSGFAEMLKHAIIADARHWEDLQEIPVLSNFSDWTSAIRRSVEIKEAICEKDPLEKGERKLLNLGHTVGHALESWFNNKGENTLKHGMAVAAGMVCETLISQSLGIISDEDAGIIITGIDQRFARLSPDEKHLPEVLALMKHDKKNQASAFRFTLPKTIGECLINQEVSDETVMNCLKQYVRHT